MTQYKTGDVVEEQLHNAPNKWKRGTVSHVNEGNNVLVRFDDDENTLLWMPEASDPKTRPWSEHDIANVENAKLFALTGHAGQSYGDGDPGSYYRDHVLAVVGHCMPYGPQCVAVAYLHDVLEDTSISHAQIRAAFGETIAEYVHLITDEPGPNRRARKARTNEKLAETKEWIPLVVKAADRLANVQAATRTRSQLAEMYRKEHPAFRTAAYRPQLCDDIWDQLEALIAQGE